MNLKSSLLINIVILGLIHTTLTSLLPSYINPCNEDDPKLRRCVKLEARRVMRKFVEGSPELGIPPMDPLYIGDIIILQANLKIRSADSTLYGLSNAKLVDFQLNPDTKTGVVTLSGDVKINSNYTISGQLLVFPISGEGESFMDIENFKIEIKWNWDTRVKKDGKRYARILDFSATHSFGKVHFNMTRLFNNDKFLGDSMNRILNENWREVMKDMGPPSVKQVVKKVIGIFNSFFSKVPVEDMFLKRPKP